MYVCLEDHVGGRHKTCNVYSFREGKRRIKIVQDMQRLLLPGEELNRQELKRGKEFGITSAQTACSSDKSGQKGDGDGKEPATTPA